MTKTIKQIAESIGTDKNVIYRIIKKLDIPEHSASDRERSGANTARYYDDTAIEQIRTEYNRMHPEQDASTREHIRNDRERSGAPDASTDDIVSVLRAQIASLTRQIESQNETIRHQDATIDRLTGLLEHEQELTKAHLLITANSKDGFFKRLTARIKKHPTE